MTQNFTMPGQRERIAAPDGLMDTTWYRFIRNLFNGTGGGVPLGTAATKAASSTVDANLASVDTPVVVNHIAQFSDVAGTIKDTGLVTGTSGLTLPFLNGSNTWSGGQTFGAGVLSAPNITNTGVLTLPTSTDTLVGKATTDILTNKTISGASNTFSNISPASIVSDPITASLGGDVAMNNTANYFDGPSIAQGSVGLWAVFGTVTVDDSAGAAAFLAKLWDGTTVTASGAGFSTTAGGPSTIALSGVVNTPAGNMRISVRDPSSTSGLIRFNITGSSKDSTISAFRIR